MAARFSPHDAPALIALHSTCSVLSPDGELLSVPASRMRGLLRDMPPPLVIHGPATARRLGLPAVGTPAPWFDLLELFAFIRPAQSVAPTPRGMARALNLEEERIGRAEADLLPVLMTELLGHAARLSKTPTGEEMAALLMPMAQAGWIWADAVREAMGIAPGKLRADALQPGDALRVWRRLPKWEETAQRPPPASQPVTPAQARARLEKMRGEHAETRAGQADFASASTTAFEPRLRPGDPIMLLAEAGTGTGKTLGYLAPASVWAEQNAASVWISTYTKHLQRQIEDETARLHPDARIRRERVVVRKGRENYLCLLNMEDWVTALLNRGADASPGALITLAMIARWATVSRDGDLMGGDLPGWFGDLMGAGQVVALADRRGECIHGACPHYQRCFVEHSIRRAREADLVIANHALVMSQAAWSRPGGLSDKVEQEDNVPTRYVFDEGHHIADAADSAFAIEFSGLEAAELRRWLLGAEGGRSRARGLRRRLDDLVVGFKRLEAPLDEAMRAARCLPAPGWSARLADEQRDPNQPPPPEPPALQGSLAELLRAPDEGPNASEMLLHHLRQQVMARARGDTRGKAAHAGTALECDLHPVEDALRDAAAQLSRALAALAYPLRTLAERLSDRLDEDAETLDSASRARIEAAVRTLHRRAVSRLDGWTAMLDALTEPRPDGITPTYVDFIRMDRREGQKAGEHDVGLHRHWLDPTTPFAATLAATAHGLLVTSATLRDRTTETEEDAEAAWDAAEERVGAAHLPTPAIRASLSSPFDYARQTRAFVVDDVAHDDVRALSAAYRSLFLASGGGGLGLFTAISRLRAVYQDIAPALDEAGLPLYAQHVDAMDNATLVDIFRTELDSCLLGTDAMRDGIDVPGNALRLVAFERVPWPRPDILHRERRVHLSHGNASAYDDRIARLKLRQAFGRLVRVRDDRGVFVLLDRRTPSRLFSAFPDGVVVERLGLAETLQRVTAFLGEGNPT